MKKDLFELKLKEEVVSISKEKITVKELTAGQASQYQHSLYKMVGNKPVVKVDGAEIKLVMLTCYDEEGNKYFESNDLELVKNLPSWVVEKLYNVANKINNPTKAELAKN